MKSNSYEEELFNNCIEDLDYTYMHQIESYIYMVKEKEENDLIEYQNSIYEDENKQTINNND